MAEYQGALAEEYAEEEDDDVEGIQNLEPEDNKLSKEAQKKQDQKEAEKSTPATLKKEEEITVVIDIGEAYTKVGFAGDEQPVKVFPTITGKEKYKTIMVDVTERTKRSYVGDDCTHMRGVLKITYPIQRGTVMDWNSYFDILTHIFYNVLRIDPQKANVLYAEGALSPLQTRKYIARVLFETYQVKSVFIANAQTLALFSAGLTTGVLVESGEGLTWVVPVIDGQVVVHAIQRLNLGGSDVNEYLKGLLMRYGLSLSYSAEREILRDIKEKLCFIALEPEKISMNSNEVADYIMPDGEKVKINMEIRANAPEILFHPELLGYNVMSLPQAIITAISKCDRSYWRSLLRNIVLSGGNTLFEGIDLRLEKELNNLLYQLGSLPEDPNLKAKSKPKPKPKPKPKLVNIDIDGKKHDTCPKCGTKVDLTKTKICPNCGYKFQETKIAIPGQPIIKYKYPDKCPHCHKKLEEESEFCPFCGHKIEKIKVKEISSKDIKIKPIEIPPIEEDLNEMVAEEFEEDAAKDEDNNKIIRIILPEKREQGIFRGASILGAIPSIKNLFITYNEFLSNPNVVDRNFYKLL
ncbi:MAG: zinc-ribbon domain-containing protein [Promethearchaeota archaeon]